MPKAILESITNHDHSQCCNHIKITFHMAGMITHRQKDLVLVCIIDNKRIMQEWKERKYI
jgi:hypothetical protein